MTKLYADPDAIIRAIERHQRAKRRATTVKAVALLAVLLLPLVAIAYFSQWLTVAGR